jgi:hypothetical protein
LANAEILGQSGTKWNEAAQLLERALPLAKTEWQQSKTQVQLAANLLMARDEASALDWIHRTAEADLAADLTAIEMAAAKVNAATALEACRDVRRQTSPRIEFDRPEWKTISHPAMLNGDFELGLSHHWAPYTRRTTATSWNNFGQSRTVAEAVTSAAQQGQRCLRLAIDCPRNSESYGWMSQAVPVTQGQRYQLRFWARAEALADDAVAIGLSQEAQGEFHTSVPLNGGTYDWTLYQLDFIPQSDEATIAIRAIGEGKLWLDALQLRLSDEAGESAESRE